MNVLEDALDRCRNEDMRTADVYAALDFSSTYEAKMSTWIEPTEDDGSQWLKREYNIHRKSVQGMSGDGRWVLIAAYQLYRCNQW